MKKIILLQILLLFTCQVKAYQYRTIASGNFSNPLIWESSTDGTTWTSATIAPIDGTHSCNIQSGHIITLDQDLILNDNIVGAAPSITIGGTLIFNNHFIEGEMISTGGSLFTLHSGATLEINNPDGLRNANLGALRNFASYVQHPMANYTFSGATNQVMKLGIDSALNNLTISSGAIVSTTESIIVNGSLSVSSGTFHLNHSLTLKGLAINTVGGTITTGTHAELHYNNAIAIQNIPSTITTLSKLTLNTIINSTINLDSPLSVTGFSGFKLMNGKLNTNAHSLTLLSDQPVIGYANSYVIGNLKIQAETFSETHNENIFFPIGSSNYQPLGITVSTPTNSGPVLIS
ncbi:MAG TPA: hypothetical protein PLU17_04475, partial [Chitinophagaceae bacterium]|nr:hypothetical protein [Chitinophagaceae bacterium]